MRAVIAPSSRRHRAVIAPSSRRHRAFITPSLRLHYAFITLFPHGVGLCPCLGLQNPEDDIMGKASRDKGKRGEREAASAIARHWNAKEARRAVQFCGRAGDADLAGVPGLHCEVKRYARLASIDFIEQAEMDAAPGMVPVVLMRDDTSTEWVCMLRVSDAPEFARRLTQMVGPAMPDADSMSGGLE